VRPEEAVDQNVPVTLPRTNAEPVNLAEERKLVLSIDENVVFYVGETEILRCLDLAPEMKALVGQKRRAWTRKDDAGFGKCLDVLAAKLGTNEKLKTDQEMYLRADESLPYAVAIKVMARVRASGVAKFGLVAEPEQDGRPIETR
jgi:biopolymer transport protein ExbD